jgi:Transglutaminase-like superfamily
MKIILIFIFFLAFSITASAKAKDYSRIDAYARATPEAKETSVETLAKYLAIPAKGDSEKVRSIFIWVTSHISYDWAAYENGTGEFEAPMTTLQKHKGVCQNFCDLFTALCIEAGMDAQTITGYAKSNISTEWMLYGFGSSNHAWNVVKVNKRWQLMEVTWAQNTGNMNYFMTDPILFRRDHLPVDPQWQLTKDTMTLEQYEHKPILKEGYDIYKVSHLTPVASCIKGKKKIEFSFDSTHTLYLEVKVNNYDYTDQTVPKFKQAITHTGNHYILSITFESEGTYWVSIELANSFKGIASYVADTHTAEN